MIVHYHSGNKQAMIWVIKFFFSIFTMAVYVNGEVGHTNNSPLPRVQINPVIINWHPANNSFISLTKKPWRNNKTQYATAGPYKIIIDIILRPADQWNKTNRKWNLISVGDAGKLNLLGNGKMVIKRMPEKREAGKRSTSTSNWRLTSINQPRQVRIALIWDGQFCKVKVDGQLWAQTYCPGTRSLNKLAIGPVPAELRRVQVIAK